MTQVTRDRAALRAGTSVLLAGLALGWVDRADAECRSYIYGTGHYLASWANQDWTYDDQAMDRMVEMGATAVWIDFPWGGMEPTPGNIDWAYADHQVATAEAHGLEMFAFVGTTPDWARLYTTLPGHQTPPAEDYLPQFISFHTAVAARYAGRVKYYQFWNEPSGCGWINPNCSNGSDCSLFTLWQRRCYNALKTGNPECVVSAGGFDGDPAGYVQCMYNWLAANGGGRAFDAISIHPYAPGGSGGPGTGGEGIDYSDLTEVRNVMVNNGDADKKIWITEYGWNTSNESQKSEDLLEVLTELKKPQYHYLFFAKYLILNGWGDLDGFGLVDSALNPRPSFDAFKDFNKTFVDSVEFTANVTSGVAPLAVQFTDESCVAGAATWHWDFGDSQSSDLQNPSHVYSGAGTYTVQLTVTGSNGPLTTQKTNLITVTPGSVDFLADVTAGPGPLTVHFTDETTLAEVTSWLWDLGDGQTSELQNPTHTYAVEGSFTVRLTVTTAGGPQMTEKAGFIRVGQFPKAAFISGSMPPTVTDAQIIDRLKSFGLLVDVYKDDPASRPSAGQISAAHDLVLASSTVLSANVAGEFRNESVPYIYWESSLSWPDREALAEDNSMSGGQTQINVVNNNHPITVGLPAGVVTLTTGGADFSWVSDPIASGATVLATLAGDASRRTVVVAEPGATLLDGGVAAGKRIFLYLYDTTWQKTNDTGKRIFDNAVSYSLGSPTADFTADRALGVAPLAVQFSDQSTGPITSWSWDFGDGVTSTLRHPSHTYGQPGTYEVSLTVTSPGRSDAEVRAAYVVVVEQSRADFDSDGDVDQDDYDHFAACSTGPGIPQDDSECVDARLDGDDDVDQADFAVFQKCFSGQDIAAGAGCAD